ncbi:cation transporter [Teredinibacter turnerae]|uniref:cation transporter n=1 Tax=Teredinibacter turnerae TaxID=2426 RepID=UPI000362EC3B|nr:cation transporter [Teredinibacter turnerae]
MSSETKTCCACNENQTAPAQVQSDIQADISHVSVFNVPQMDCPSEESLIRTAFASVDDVVTFKFDIASRKVTIYHPDMADKVEKAMTSVGLGAKLISRETVDQTAVQHAIKAAKSDEQREARVLRWLLGINALMFVFEFVVGIIAQSTGLIADSLDMFADAAVYGVSLYAVGKATKLKLKAAHFSGWLQIALALGVLLEVVRRFLYGGEPVSSLMMVMGAVALIANITCLLLIFKSREQGSHMKASWIFSANDVLANAGVIMAGFLVAVTGSQMPDLVIGLLIAGLVTWGGIRILRLK